MNIFSYRPGLAIAIAAIVSTSCSAASDGRILSAPKEKVYLVATCDKASVKKKSFSSSKLIVNPGIFSDQCLDLQASVNFRPGYFHVVPYKNNLFAIRLSCSNADEDIALFKTVRGRDVGLVIGDSLIGVYGTNGTPTAKDCGLFSVEDIGKAMDICLAATKEWGVNRDGCMALCDEKNENGVCVEHAP